MGERESKMERWARGLRWIDVWPSGRSESCRLIQTVWWSRREHRTSQLLDPNRERGRAGYGDEIDVDGTGSGTKRSIVLLEVEWQSDDRILPVINKLERHQCP
jgi:hypothetical protein